MAQEEKSRKRQRRDQSRRSKTRLLRAEAKSVEEKIVWRVGLPTQVADGRSTCFCGAAIGIADVEQSGGAQARLLIRVSILMHGARRPRRARSPLALVLWGAAHSRAVEKAPTGL